MSGRQFQSSVPGATSAFSLNALSRAAILVILTLLAYIPAMRGGFVWDDDSYVTNNTAIRSAVGLGRIWFAIGATPQYYPLVFTTFWAEYQLWGLDPLVYHIVNVALHALGGVLLWLVLRRLAVPGAWLAAAAFAVHPVHVESVAWITERKNVLSGVFYLAAILAYTRSVRLDLARAPARLDGRWYAAALFLFLCALLSKTVTCSLPAAILLLLWWKRDRFEPREILPLIPMIVIGAAMGLLTAWIERYGVGAEGDVWTLGPLDRCLVAGRAIWFYASKLIWPVHLTFGYPRWQIDTTLWWQYLYPATVLLVLFLLWLTRQRIGKAPIVAMLFFVVTLFPALGFVNVYPMRYSFVADHFQYLASIGPIALLVATAAMTLSRQGDCTGKSGQTGDTPRVRPSVLVLGVALLGTLAALTWRQGHSYRDAETLWADTLTRNPGSWLAHNNMGTVLARRGDSGGAVAHFREAVRLEPDYTEAQYNLASALADQGRFDEAINHYTEVLRLEPRDAEAHYGLGRSLAVRNRIDEAIRHLTEAVRLNPGNPEAQSSLATALAGQGRLDDAMAHFAEAVRLRPAFPEAHNNLGLALAARGRLDEAAEHHTQALRLRPDYPEAHNNLAILLAGQGRVTEAMEHYAKALRFKPASPEIRSNLASALVSQGRLEEAAQQYRKAIELAPAMAAAHEGLGVVLERQGALAAAAQEYQEALRLNPGNTELQGRVNRLQGR